MYGRAQPSNSSSQHTFSFAAGIGVAPAKVPTSEAVLHVADVVHIAGVRALELVGRHKSPLVDHVRVQACSATTAGKVSPRPHETLTAAFQLVSWQLTDSMGCSIEHLGGEFAEMPYLGSPWLATFRAAHRGSLRCACAWKLCLPHLLSHELHACCWRHPTRPSAVKLCCRPRTHAHPCTPMHTRPQV